LNAVKRVKRIKGALQMIGIDPARLEFYNLSAAQGPRWAEICTEFTQKISAMGPSPIWFALRKKKESTENKKQAA
jgi:coenzyme F420-reducing hydrogenase delta subunit